MKYTVTITETVIETRELEIEADSPEAAHRAAHKQYMDKGKEADSAYVEERSFTVLDPATQETLAEFDNDPADEEPV